MDISGSLHLKKAIQEAQESRVALVKIKTKEKKENAIQNTITCTLKEGFMTFTFSLINQAPYFTCYCPDSKMGKYCVHFFFILNSLFGLTVVKLNFGKSNFIE